MIVTNSDTNIIPFNDLPVSGAIVLITSSLPNSAVPGIKLITPFQDPINTFRATSVEQMYFIVPSISSMDTIQYNIGNSSSFPTTIYSVQNNTVSHSLSLTINAPAYLTYNIPTISSIPPKTIANFIVSFNNANGEQLLPNEYQNELDFTVAPLNVFGPVFVDKNATPPPDLNLISSSVPPIVAVTSSQIVYVDRPIYINIPNTASVQLYWKDGTTGEIKPGSPPTGWIIEADGAAYPPIEPPSICDSSSAGSAQTNAQQLLNEVAGVPSGSGSTRIGIYFDITDFQVIPGAPLNMINKCVPGWVLDIGPTKDDIVIQNISNLLVNGSAYNKLSTQGKQNILITQDGLITVRKNLKLFSSNDINSLTDKIGYFSGLYAEFVLNNKSYLLLDTVFVAFQNVFSVEAPALADVYPYVLQIVALQNYLAKLNL